MVGTMASQRPDPPLPADRRRPVNRIAVNVLLDGLLAALSAPLARWLADPRGGLLHPLWFVAGGAITLIISGLPFRVQQQYWRFSGVGDLLNIAGASVASAILFALGLHITGFPIPTPTFPIIHALVLLTLMGGIRIIYRLSYRRTARRQASSQVILVGSDNSADLFIRAVERAPDPAFRVAGIVTQGRRQAGRRIHGIPILGHVEGMDDILARLDGHGGRPERLVITDAAFRGEDLAEIMQVAERRGLTVLRAPVLTDLTPADRLELRPVAIEDLLNRPQVGLDHDGMAALLGGRTVLVTGAGGSIGSELARQIAEYEPGRLLLLDHGEFALWQIDVELSERAPRLRRETILADIRDRARIEQVCAQYRPELVFHAAALKHVPMVEANPCEGVLTNVIGTRIVADAAARHGARALVMVSTDKAVNPSSLMGASKRAAEMYCQALDVEARTGDESGVMRCVTVRFGNVLGSTGSVVPLFRRQLERGGPLTVTHPDMQRYFMTVSEAVGLVLQASVRGTIRARAGSGTDTLLRSGGIFVLDMGKPIRIVDLARQMIRLAGLRPDQDVPIRFTGLRPGEKLFEELFHGREAPVATDHPGLKMATPRMVDRGAVGLAIDTLEAACRAEDTPAVLALIGSLVPEFAHNPTGDVRDRLADPTDAERTMTP
ncbi:polysaccharide biosynthesis protein [Gluconacetobacter diazotrophicus]|uniref:Polysaccharide biosynthesis protein n=2 Tax=Gluconacetobacter diazotrophicus TaxID=33996 RepID=A0A7W4FEF4_GLUDI|nr:polysaccharide biosynthesis protein [Gluconacetobacter diazotrophicus]